MNTAPAKYTHHQAIMLMGVSPSPSSRIIEEARDANAVPVTTAKDAARLPSDLRSAIQVLDVRLEWRDEAALERVLAPVMRQKFGPDG